WRRCLQASLAVGSLYDFLVGAAVLLLPDLLASGLGLPLPADQFYLRFIGVFLLGLGLIYLLPVLDPERYAAVAGLAGVVRAMGCVFLAGAVGLYHRPGVFLLLAAADGSFAFVHLASLAGWRRSQGKS
ncbi:MAG: hypothetical protein ACE5ID_12435, partial [Acidobacteriota bacterium]